jgi:hypothetical protein
MPPQNVRKALKKIARHCIYTHLMAAAYLCFHMHMAHIKRLCQKLQMPLPAVSLDTSEEDMFTLIYDLDRMMDSDDEQVRRISTQRFRLTHPLC